MPLDHKCQLCAPHPTTDADAGILQTQTLPHHRGSPGVQSAAICGVGFGRRQGYTEAPEPALDLTHGLGGGPLDDVTGGLTGDPVDTWARGWRAVISWT
jgi:hypothetical protein